MAYISEGIMNPHIRERIMNPHIRERRLRSLRTPSQQTIGPVGRGPLTTAEAAYHKGNVGRRTLLDSIGDWTRRNKHTLQTPMSDARRMVKDLAPINVNDLYNQWLAGEQGVLPYYFNQPPEGSPEFSPVGVTGRPTLPAEMHEGFEPILGNPGIPHPYFGNKRWNPNDMSGTETEIFEAELPRWEILNRAKRLWPFSRGGIASLRYAR